MKGIEEKENLTKQSTPHSVGVGDLDDPLQRDMNFPLREDDILPYGVGASNEGSYKEPFFIVPSNVFSYGLNPYELSALFYLCMRADNKNHSCWPSEKTMAKECGMGKTSLCKSIGSLNDKGIISIKKQYQQGKNGKNRQTSNYYRVIIFDDSHTHIDTISREDKTKNSSSPHDTPNTAIHTPPYRETTPPIPPRDWEINKTISNITISNLTKSNELSMSEAEEVLKERNEFISLKKECFEKLKLDYNVEEDYVLLLDRALEHLWSRKDVEYDGSNYRQHELRALLSKDLTPQILAYCVSSFDSTREPIRSPVPYLSKCILGAILHPNIALFRHDNQSTATASNCAISNQISSKTMDNNTTQNDDSFDLHEFFAAALRRSDSFVI